MTLMDKIGSADACNPTFGGFIQQGNETNQALVVEIIGIGRETAWLAIPSHPDTRRFTARIPRRIR